MLHSVQKTSIMHIKHVISILQNHQKMLINVIVVEAIININYILKTIFLSNKFLMSDKNLIVIILWSKVVGDNPAISQTLIRVLLLTRAAYRVLEAWSTWGPSSYTWDYFVKHSQHIPCRWCRSPSDPQISFVNVVHILSLSV